MTIVNNVYAIRVNSVSNNGSINFGTTSHYGHRVTKESRVGYVHSGDMNDSFVQFDNVNEGKRTEKAQEKKSSEKKK